MKVGEGKEEEGRTRCAAIPPRQSSLPFCRACTCSL